MIIKRPQKITSDNLLSFLETKYKEFNWKSKFPQRKIEFEISQGDYCFLLIMYYDESLSSAYEEIESNPEVAQLKKRIAFYYSYKEVKVTKKRPLIKNKKEWIEEAGEVSVFVKENNFTRANNLLNKIQKYILDKETKNRKKQEEVYLGRILNKLKEFLS